MSWIVVPVIAGKHRQLKTVRIVASERFALTLRRDETVTFSTGDDEAHDVDLANVSEHDALDDAIVAARDMIGGDERGEPPGPTSGPRRRGTSVSDAPAAPRAAAPDPAEAR